MAPGVAHCRAMTTDHPKARNRVVAIVGRPNVGKSALFNRLAGRRLAIVHAEPGVTRDRLMRDVLWNDERLELIDTGGVCNADGSQARDRIEAGIRQQVDAALGDAGVAILVVDLAAGPHPLDEDVAGLLRGSGCRIVVAANKADTHERDDDAHAFAGLGFPVFPVSALHNRGIGDLTDAVLAMLPATVDRSVTEPLRVAVVGRPNVGKSSYINRLLRNERVIVSDVPGTTRDSIDIPFMVGSGSQARHYVLVDTAGMRRAGKVSTAVEKFSLFRAEQSIRGANVVVLVLDAVRGPTAQDKKIAALIQEHRKGCLLLVNKWDLAMDEVTQRKYGPAIQATMPFMGYCPIVFASAETGFNIRRTIDTIDHVAAQIRIDLPTGVLNRAIGKAYAKIRPPSFRGKALKIYYGAQVGVDPLRIRLFVNNPEAVRVQYTDYLIRSLREQFGLEGAPLVIQYQSRREERKGADGDGHRRAGDGTAPAPRHRPVRKTGTGDARRPDRKTGMGDGRRPDRKTGPGDARRPDRKTGPGDGRKPVRETGPGDARRADRETGAGGGRKTVARERKGRRRMGPRR